MKSRFVRPDTAALTISNGDTLTVKRELTSGEQRAAYARLYLAGTDGRVRPNPFATGIALVTAYLIDWTLRDDDGRLVSIRDKSVEQLTAIIDGLDQASFLEIKEAIEAHEAAVNTARDLAKKETAGEKNGSAISPSPSGVAGPWSGSETLT